jgi:GT2 family glycosyltransferase
MNKGSVTLSVISHEQHSLVDALIADLAGCESPELARVILTQNLPETPPSTKGRRSPPVEVIRNRTPLGFGMNHNAAFRKCDTEYFAVVNPDIALTTNPFPAMLAELRAGAGVAAPVVLEPDGRIADTARSLITPYELIHRRTPTYTPPETPRWFAGMFLVFRSDAFAAVGGFDEGFFMYCEDFDICARLRLAGWPLAFVRQVQVVHAAQQLSHRSLRHFRWHLSSLGRMWTSSNFWRYRRMVRRLEADEDAGAGLRPREDARL